MSNNSRSTLAHLTSLGRLRVWTFYHFLICVHGHVRYQTYLSVDSFISLHQCDPIALDLRILGNFANTPLQSLGGCVYSQNVRVRPCTTLITVDSWRESFVIREHRRMTA